MRYIQRWDDKPFEVASHEVTRWACCDCGLVHDIAFVAQGETIGVAARVNKRATSARRRSSSPPPLGLEAGLPTVPLTVHAAKSSSHGQTEGG